MQQKQQHQNLGCKARESKSAFHFQNQFLIYASVPILAQANGQQTARFLTVFHCLPRTSHHSAAMVTVILRKVDVNEFSSDIAQMGQAMSFPRSPPPPQLVEHHHLPAEVWAQLWDKVVANLAAELTGGNKMCCLAVCGLTCCPCCCPCLWG